MTSKTENRLARLCLIALVPLAGVATSVAQETQPAAPAPAAEQAAPAQPPSPTAQDRVAALKQSLGASMAALRTYEWMETTVVSMKGEEKSRKQNRCYYGADGKVMKVPVESAPAAPAKEKRGVRGKVVENKKEEIGDSVKEAIGLVKSYVPPDPARIQAAKDAGKVSVNPPDAQGKVQMVIKDYLKAGDSLTVDLNAAKNTLAGLTVASFTDKEKNAVGLKVSMGALTDGTTYPANIVLDVKSQNMTIAITNSGYKKTGA
jgi:hypothetical protein